MKSLTNRERHNRIFWLILFGGIFVAGIRFLLIDPSWVKFMIALLPIVISVACLFIFGEPYLRTGWLVSVAVTTGIEWLALHARLGSWQQNRFWANLVFLVMLNFVVFLYTVPVMFWLVRRAERARSKEVEVMDYRGKFPPRGN